MAESEEELKSLLMKVKEKSEKHGLKLNMKKTKIMASVPITSWQIDEEKMQIVTDFIFLGSKITVDSDCSHEIKRHFLLGRKAMTNLGSILKSRDISLPTKVYIVKAMVFPVVMYGCESWTTTIIRTRRDLPLIESIVVLMVKNTPASAEDLRDTGSMPGLGRSSGGRNATHSSILAWRIPWTEEPGRLQSKRSQRIRQD